MVEYVLNLLRQVAVVRETWKTYQGYTLTLSGRNVVYRLNTFPVVHTGFLHAIVNLVALIPLLERFETEHGTLVSIALFTGRRFQAQGGKVGKRQRF